MGLDIQRLLKEIQDVISELKGVEIAKNIVIEALDSGVDPVDVVNAMGKGLEIVGQKYEKENISFQN